MKTIYYYQTFTGLDKCIENSQDIDVIIAKFTALDTNKDRRLSMRELGISDVDAN